MIIWDKMRSGDENAYRQIYENHFDMLHRYGRKIAWDEGQCEDCIQDLFIKLWQKRDSLGTTDSIKNYLFTSLRRLIIRKQKDRSKATDPVDMKNHDDAEPTFEEFLIQDEIDEEKKQKLQSALTQISARQREVIYLRFYQNMEYEEICEVMNISYQGARNMLFKAVKSMKDKLSLIFFSLIGYKYLNAVFDG